MKSIMFTTCYHRGDKTELRAVAVSAGCGINQLCGGVSFLLGNVIG